MNPENQRIPIRDLIVFEPRTATGGELFSYLTCLHTTTFIFLLKYLFLLTETISLKYYERTLSLLS